MLRLDEVGPATPRIPDRALAVPGQVAAAGIVHLAAALTLIFALTPPAPPASVVPPVRTATARQPVDVRHIVFVATDPRLTGAGGGGGGNRQTGPIRRAEGIGSDAITLRVARKPPLPAPFESSASMALVEDVPPLPSVMLDAKSLASGTTEQVGLPTGGVSFGTSTGPGSGGGVGTGIGTGIGPGHGPGIGPGSGGGIGGGTYRPGGAVTTPRVLVEVKPTYTTDALHRRIQGTVVLELIVTREGRPSQIRVIRSLDPEGLDECAVAAAAQWRFEPGRLAGTPVDVLVTIMLDFWIR
jgi:TonB family protein